MYIYLFVAECGECTVYHPNSKDFENINLEASVVVDFYLSVYFCVFVYKFYIYIYIYIYI